MRLAFTVLWLLGCLTIIPFLSRAQSVWPVGQDSTFNALQAVKDDSLRISQLLNYATGIEAAHPAEAISLTRKLTDEAQHYHIGSLWLKGLINLGFSYLENADYTRSLSYFTQAQKLANAFGRRVDEVDALKALSMIYMHTHDLPKSQRYLKIADSVARKFNLIMLLPDLISEMGIRYAEAHQYDSAVICYREAIALAKQENQESVAQNARVNMAISFKNLGMFREALAIYREELKAARLQQNIHASAVITDNMANVLFESGDLAQSEREALNALEMSKNMDGNAIYLLQDMYPLLIKLYERKGAIPQAYAYTRKLLAIKDSIFNEQSAKQLQEASVRFDTELKDSQIMAQQAQIRYRNRLALFLAGGILLLLIAGISTYLSQQKVRRLNRQITAQKGELERLNSVKDRIFSAISHDVRTPLSSLFSFSRLLSEGNITAEKLPHYTAQLNGQLSYTMGLMDNLLHWARSQMQGFQPVAELLDILDAIAEAAAAVAAEATQKGVAVTQAVAGGAVIKADRQMTALVLRNLLHNAVKYTPKGGSVAIYGEAVEGALRLSVTDTGTGIDAATVTAFNMQEPMQSKPGTSGEKGTGLGLLLCKSLAAAMGGRLELRSRPGEGSSFVLVLPAMFP